MGTENEKKDGSLDQISKAYDERMSTAFTRVAEIVREMENLSTLAELTLKTDPQTLAEVFRTTLEIIEMACREAPVNDLETAHLQIRGGPEAIDFIRKHLVVKREPPKIAETPENLSLWHPQCRIISHEETILSGLYLETGLLSEGKTPATVYLAGPKWVTLGNQ